MQNLPRNYIHDLDGARENRTALVADRWPNAGGGYANQPSECVDDALGPILPAYAVRLLARKLEQPQLPTGIADPVLFLAPHGLLSDGLPPVGHWIHRTPAMRRVLEARRLPLVAVHGGIVPQVTHAAVDSGAMAEWPATSSDAGEPVS